MSTWARTAFRQCRSLLEKSFEPKYLMVTNTLTCGVLMSAGDVIEQRLEKGRKEIDRYDLPRNGRMFVVGLTQGPTQQVWYAMLDKYLPKKTPGAICLKIVADQVVAAPFFSITFFYFMGLLEGKSLSDCYDEFAQKFWTVYLCDWCFWPPAQFINFALVAPKFRVLYVSVATVVWNVFLSYIKHYDELDIKEEEK